MGSCSSSSSNAERRDVVNVTVLRPPPHATGTAASHDTSEEMRPQHEKAEKKEKDEKEKKKENKKGDKTKNKEDEEKKDKKKDKNDKEKENKDKKKYKKEDKQDDNTEDTKKEKKKKKKRKDDNDGSKEVNCSSDSSSSTEDEADHEKAKDGDGGAAASKDDLRLSVGGIDTAVTQSADAIDGEKRIVVADVECAGIVEVSPVAPPLTGQIVVQADTEASVSIEAHIDLNDQSQTTRNDANVTIKMTDDHGGDGEGGAMSVDIVLSPSGGAEVAIYGGSGGEARLE